MSKRRRILTKRGYSDPKYYQGIEVEEFDGRDYLFLVDPDGSAPVDVTWVKELFAAEGREYRESGKEFAWPKPDPNAVMPAWTRHA